MFKKKPNCPRCKSKVSDSFDFCPYCGVDMSNPEKDSRDFGMLGKNELVGQPMVGGMGGMGITDKMINSLVRNLFKAFDKQMKDLDTNTSSQGYPNKIKIRFGFPTENKKESKKQISQEQIKRMTGLPRVEASTDVRRLSDKIVYELKAPGINSADDVFVSKLEQGYEVKAIGKRKVYVNSLPVNLPLKGYKLSDKGLILEFGLE